MINLKFLALVIVIASLLISLEVNAQTSIENQTACTGTYPDVYLVTSTSIIVRNPGSENIYNITCFTSDGTPLPGQKIELLVPGNISAITWTKGGNTSVVCSGLCRNIGVTGECRSDQSCWSHDQPTIKPNFEIWSCNYDFSTMKITLTLHNNGNIDLSDLIFYLIFTNNTITPINFNGTLIKGEYKSYVFSNVPSEFSKIIITSIKYGLSEESACTRNTLTTVMPSATENMTACVGTYPNIIYVSSNTILITNPGSKPLIDITCYTSDGTTLKHFENLYPGEISSMNWTMGANTSVVCRGKCLLIGVSGECKSGQSCWQSVPTPLPTLPIELLEAYCSNNGVINFIIKNKGSIDIDSNSITITSINEECLYDPVSQTIKAGKTAIFTASGCNGPRTHTYKISGPSNSIIVASLCSKPINLICSKDSDCVEKIFCPMIIGNDTPRCINDVCECGPKPETIILDKTTLVQILIQIETLRAQLESLKIASQSLLNYYVSINDTKNIQKWSNVINLFDQGITNLENIKNYIRTIKEVPTQNDITQIKNQIGNSLTIIDKILDVILSV